MVSTNHAGKLRVGDGADALTNANRGTTLGRSGSRLVPVLVALAVVASACSGGDHDDRERAAPSGPPVRVGLINLEGAPGGSVKDLRLGAEAAVAYVNAELNGVNGRPLELEVCITTSSPEVSAQCAQRMAQEKVVAVIGGVDVGSSASLPILTQAGIPYLGAAPLLPADFTTDGAFMFSPGGMANAASAAFAADQLGARRVSILQADDRPGAQLTDVFVRPALIAHGVRERDITVVAEQADAADLAPAVAAANRPDPDAIIVLFPPPACARIMQAAAALGVEAPMFYIARCGDPSVLAAGGAGAEGIYFVTAVLNAESSADDGDVRTFVRAIREYGNDDLDPASVDAANGFATTMTVYQRLTTIADGSVDAATVIASFRAAVDQPAFMGRSYTCDGQQAVPEWVSVCNVWVRMYQFTGGRYRDASGEWISARAALANP
jgi:branched-chain amino acid transport system substrate-binding protein